MSDSFRVVPVEALRAIDVPSPPEDASGAPTCLPAPSNRESDETYRGVITYLDDKCRVIDCMHSIQWILQKYRGGQWHSDSFHRNRDVLIERSGATGEALKALEALPEWHP